MIFLFKWYTVYHVTKWFIYKSPYSRCKNVIIVALRHRWRPNVRAGSWLVTDNVGSIQNTVTIPWTESKMTRRARDVTRAALCGCGYRSDKLVTSRSCLGHRGASSRSHAWVRYLSGNCVPKYATNIYFNAAARAWTRGASALHLLLSKKYYLT